MISINKSEKDAILKRFPTVHIVRTMKQKSKRHHYYCEEAKPVLKYLKELRSGNKPNRKVGAKDGFKKA